MKTLVIAAAMLGLLTAPALRAEERVSHGRFKDVRLYRPQGEVKAFVLLLSGDGGLDRSTANMARGLVDQGAMVAGINVSGLIADLERDADRCVSPDGDLESLSHFVQGYAKLPTYYTPMLVGYSSGASLAYAMIAQAPPGTFSAAISLGFCTDLEMRKPLCKGEDARFARRSNRKGVDLLPTDRLQVPWVVFHGARDALCDAAATRAFVARVPGGGLVELPEVGHDYSDTANWLPQYIAAYRSLAASPAAVPPPPSSLADLPLVEVATTGNTDLFAVLLSGDGGWAGLDKDVAAALSARGIPVVGLDSLRYFWSAREPLGLATDLDRVLRYYAARWGRRRAVLIGYSQGADVLPFALNRLPETSRPLVVQTVLIGLGERASFEFHIGNWIGRDPAARPVLPELLKLSAATTLCIYGKDEQDAVCPKIPAAHVRAQSLPGGHHFDGKYDRLAELIMSRSKPP